MPPVIPSTGDPVQWAIITGPNAGSAAVPDGSEGCDVEWLVRCDRPDATAFEIGNSTKLPRPGEALYRYRPTAGGYPAPGWQGTYAKFGLISARVQVANYDFSQHADDPYLWRVTVRYEGVGDPTTVPAEVSSESVEYQTCEWIDATGRPVENSALDPILGGMPVDRSNRMLRITRAVPYTLWDMDRGTAYENTLNLLPFTLSRQTRGGSPVVLPPGTVRLKRITEQEVVRAAHPDAASRSYYWRVTAELHIDKRQLRLADVRLEPTLHRWPVADAGYRELSVGATRHRMPIYDSPVPSNEMQLLDGSGSRLHAEIPPPPPVELVTAGDLPSQPDYYTAYAGVPLPVPSPGVLINDGAPLGATAVKTEDPDHGTVVLNVDGSFVYTPNPGFTGWDTFRYKVEAGGLFSASTPVHILVRAGGGPVWLLFHRYPYADWTALAPILLNW
jgi:hypothetical protein